MATLVNAGAAHYACTALVGTNKTGKLPKDENGYYTVILGALDVFNGNGAYYPFETGKHIFEESSILMRRVKDGALRGEYGHPKRAPGSSLQEHMVRCCNIVEDMVSHHIKEIWLDPKTAKGPDGRAVVLIMAKVKPCGPYGKYLADQFENPDENVCFSIRSFTNDQMIGGVLYKNLKVVFTWDYVNEPGIGWAKKYNSPTLECMVDGEALITQDIIASMKDTVEGQGNESVGLMVEELLRAFVPERNYSKPASASW